ncbi:MAG: SDR family oxidoreductase [Victivallales bacterium]|jgi:NAD(P)-dependent dehydrogenase (short-subunit alcohol dehydrogenase family)
MRFKDKVVLVTGAVRNTGLAIAEAFAREGAVVALNGRKSEDVAREAKRLRETYGVKVVEVTADISCPDQVDAMFAKIERECGSLDVLVNNAIIQGVGYSLVDTPLSVLEEVFRINVFGTYHCSQCAARMMLKKGAGAIVNIGSNTAERAILKRTAYVASKGAINSLNRAMALELGPKGIRVNCVVAGYIHTDRWAKLTTEAARRRANIPVGKEADGNDIAEAVLFMASENAARINGAGLVVDGGISVQLVPPDCDC